MTKQRIYEFMNGRDVSSSFSDPSHNSELPFNDFVAVMQEEKRVLSEIIKLMTEDNTKTKQNCIDEIESELDVEIVIDNNIKNWDKYILRFTAEEF